MNMRGPLATVIFLVIVMAGLGKAYRKSHAGGRRHEGPAHALWLGANAFDGHDDGKFPFLDAKAHPEGYYCFNAGAYEYSTDEELRQVYLQAAESGRGFGTMAECVARLVAGAQISAAAVCVPSENKFSFDYTKQACVKVGTPCGPGIRPRMEGNERRVFLKVYDSAELCAQGARAK